MEINGKRFDEERALYGSRNVSVYDCSFDGPADGESALKESSGVTAQGCIFNLRYPLWHASDVSVTDCDMTENCRAPIWYSRGIDIYDSRIYGVKALRECENIYIENCDVQSAEFMWKCSSVSLSGGSVVSEYPFLECRNADADSLKITGKYSFQYVENAQLENCVFDTKDAFWHSKNVTVVDSIINGEYLGWYSENLKLIRCRIIGTQPLCYCRGLVLEECTMENAGFAFERSEVTAWVRGDIESVKNPLRGSITADSIGQIIMQEEYCDPSATKIKTGNM